MKKIYITLVIVCVIIIKMNAQQNGTSTPFGPIEFGDPPGSNNSQLMHDTYLPLWNYNMFWYDGANPGYGQNKFNFGNGNILVDRYINLKNDAKFTVTNSYDYNTSFISSTSPDANTVLWVDHSNWRFSPGTTYFLGTNYPKLTGIFSHISNGATGDNSLNIGVQALLDTILGLKNIGVQGRVLIEKSYADSIQSFNNTVNVGGEFITEADYQNLQNIGVNIKSTSNNIYSHYPVANTGININVENALNVDGLVCNAINGTSSNNGLNINSTVTSGNNNLASSIYGGKFFTNGARTANVGVYSEINNSGYNLVNSANYGFKTNLIGNDNNQQWITGFYGNVSYNQHSNTVKGADLQVTNNHASLVNTGINVNVNSNNAAPANISQCNYGVFSQVVNNDSSLHNIGVYSLTHNDSAKLNVGVYGEAGGSSDSISKSKGNIAVWGKVSTRGTWTFPPPTLPQAQNDVAGLFNGDVVITGTLLTPSDIFLKENIVPLRCVLPKLLKIEPRSYLFKTKDYESMSLSWRLQYGLIAPEVYGEFPNLVQTLTNPAILDSKGNVIHKEIQYEGINYQGFIPLLIQGEKELKYMNDSIKSTNYKIIKSNDSLKHVISDQQNKIDKIQNSLDELESKFNSLSSLVNDCCSSQQINKSSSKDENDINIFNQDINNYKENNTTLLYQNKPNPFKSNTTFVYKIGQAGYVELEVTDQFGRVVAKLVNTTQAPGYYTIEWDSINAAPGIYFYSLKINNLLLVKKAVKIN